MREWSSSLTDFRSPPSWVPIHTTLGVQHMGRWGSRKHTFLGLCVSWQRLGWPVTRPFLVAGIQQRARHLKCRPQQPAPSGLGRSRQMDGMYYAAFVFPSTTVRFLLHWRLSELQGTQLELSHYNYGLFLGLGLEKKSLLPLGLFPLAEVEVLLG